MSGVVDAHGQQWEPCHKCGKYVRFPQNLGYTAGYKEHRCLKCANEDPDIESIIPAPEWLPNYEEIDHA